MIVDSIKPWHVFPGDVVMTRHSVLLGEWDDSTAAVVPEALFGIIISVVKASDISFGDYRWITFLNSLGLHVDLFPDTLHVQRVNTRNE